MHWGLIPHERMAVFPSIDSPRYQSIMDCLIDDWKGGRGGGWCKNDVVGYGMTMMAGKGSIDHKLTIQIKTHKHTDTEKASTLDSQDQDKETRAGAAMSSVEDWLRTELHDVVRTYCLLAYSPNQPT
jgi:hypothetical protein